MSIEKTLVLKPFLRSFFVLFETQYPTLRYERQRFYLKYALNK